MKGILATIVLLTATLGLGSTALAESSGDSGDVSTLASGTYFAQGSLFARSYRVFGKENGRACVKIVDGPPNPYEGFQNITVSTIADTNEKLVVRATQAEFIVRGPEEFVIGDGRSGVWQLTKNAGADLAAGLSDCLTATGQYTKQFRGPFVTGRIAPVPKPANPDAFLIVPGKSVGKITKQTDRQGLVTIFGAANVEDFTERGPEGIGEAPATRITIGGKQSLRVIWKDDTRKQIGSIAIYDARWHFADGLAVDMTAAALQAKFGKFEFYGFGWDYSGTVISKNNPKLDKYRQSLGVNFTLGVPSGLCQQFSADCRSVSGDAMFWSDNPRLKSLKPRIEVLYVRF